MLNTHIVTRITTIIAFGRSNVPKKLFKEWNAAAAKSEFVFRATNPIPQLPSNKIKKNIRFAEVKSKFKCHTNHKTAINSIPINFGK